jgi:repressor of nif and glnA expression
VVFKTEDVEHKVLSILKVLGDSREPMGSRKIAQSIGNYGIHLSEAAIRYHLRFLDESGLTTLAGKRDGRKITEKGLVKIRKALLSDRAGYVINRIDLASFLTNFDYQNLSGDVPVNVSIFHKDNFHEALQAMKPVFESNYCVSQLVFVAESEQRLGDISIPKGKIGLATVCSIIINGTLQKAGIPIDSKFGGLLEIVNRRPSHFSERIDYNGSSLVPSEIFLRARMTSVRETVLSGSGKILASFREIPPVCEPLAKEVLARLSVAGLRGVTVSSSISEPICETQVEPNKVGLILVAGLNAVAAAQEIGIEVENHGMSTVIDYHRLIKYTEI